MQNIIKQYNHWDYKEFTLRLWRTIEKRAAAPKTKCDSVFLFKKIMFTPREIEAIEAEAWQNMFDIAPEGFRKKMNLYYEKIHGGTCCVFPKFPVVHFNMVIGLGFTETLTGEIMKQVEKIYN